MKKLSLRIEDVCVDSCEMSGEAIEAVGTVKGAAAITRWTFCFDETCISTCEVDC